MAKRKHKKRGRKDYESSKANNPHYYYSYESDPKDIQKIAFAVFGSLYYNQES